ncbi:MAG: hypothetical protein MUF54_13345, partial [Polyangiaceae bacterium]|nr:hypothetical protein [Polyangiaceae bacterium]
AYLLYFPEGGAVRLDLGAARGGAVKGAFARRWLDIVASRWGEVVTVEGGGKLELRAPDRGHWACLLRKAPR